MRLIDADKLYKYIDDEIYTTDKYAEVEDILNIIAEFAEETPNKWIPVSERLPETPGRYLTYIVNKHDTNYRYIMTCEYVESDLWRWFPDDECASDNVVAWLPLPKPYRTESER